MKLTITHLKAPWPEGAKVGDVVEFAGLPAWAVGKCKPADDEAEVTLGADGPIFSEATEGEGATTEEVEQAIAEAGDVVEVADAAPKGKAKK